MQIFRRLKKLVLWNVLKQKKMRIHILDFLLQMGVYSHLFYKKEKLNLESGFLYKCTEDQVLSMRDKKYSF